MFDSLAGELILEVLEHLKLNENRLLDARALKQYSLVHRTWTPHAQRLLFSRVALTRPSHIRSFRAALEGGNTANGAFLGRCVKHLRILVAGSFNDIDQVDFARIVYLCPALKNLDLDVTFLRTGRGLEENALQILRQSTGPKALRLRSFDYIILRQLQDAWPGIKHLETISFPLGKSDASPDDAVCSLYEYRDSNMNHMPWVLSKSITSLRILAFQHTHSSNTSNDSTPFAETLLRAVGPHLLSLTTNSMQTISSCLQYCKRLLEYRCIGVPGVNELASLPRTVEHLEIQLMVNARQPLVSQSFLKEVARFPKLRVLTVCRASLRLDRQEPNISDILDTCAQLKVRVRHVLPMQGYKEDMVEVSRFPRFTPGETWVS